MKPDASRLGCSLLSFLAKLRMMKLTIAKKKIAPRGWRGISNSFQEEILNSKEDNA